VSGLARIIIDGETIEVELDEATLARIERAVRAGRRKRERDLDRQVRHYLKRHLGATKEEVVTEITRRRADVLAAVDRVRGKAEPGSGLGSPESGVPCARNGKPGAGA
jgi:hypothetical protein